MQDFLPKKNYGKKYFPISYVKFPISMAGFKPVIHAILYYSTNRTRLRDSVSIPQHTGPLNFTEIVCLILFEAIFSF